MAAQIATRSRCVLFVIHYPVFGGPHNQAVRLHQPLARRGWEMLVLLPDEPGNSVARLRAAGVEVVQMALHRLRARIDPRLHVGFVFGFASEVARIRRLIRERQVNLVLLGGLVNPHAAIAARLESVPVVWQLLDTRTPIALRRAMMPLVTAAADVVMSTGMEVARVHPGALDLGERLVPFVPPVDVKLFRPDPVQRAVARAELGLKPEHLVIGNVSNVNPQKGHGTFIRAAAVLRRSYSDLRFVILGAIHDTHTGYAAALWREATAMGLRPGEDLIVHDPGSRVAELASAFDVFWLTSEPRSEGIPTVVEEAMALALPVVTVDVAATREIVEDGVTGFVVSARDPEAIASATVHLLRDPGLRTRMGEEGRRRAVEHYDVEVCANTHVRAFEAAIAHHLIQSTANVPNPAKLPVEPKILPEIQHLLACPACRTPLAWSAALVRCETCARTYPVTDGIPILLLDQAAAEHDELEHLHTHEHKHRQAVFFDREEAAEFEITRPHGTPGLYRWLLGEKFRHSIAGLESVLAGATVLSVCGGSGMDAEFLARAGARVIVSDISVGAARRARERARRYGLAVTPIVADVEHLPFQDQAVDLVYVHDGLHHLEEPLLGLAEMARVAARAVSVTEPARAAVTAVAVRLGLALEREEAGNRVARIRLQEVEGYLRSCGFQVRHAERYAMYYCHEPGRVCRALSLPGLLPAVTLGWRLANAVIGRLGNKVSVVAVRDGAA